MGLGNIVQELTKGFRCFQKINGTGIDLLRWSLLLRYGYNGLAIEFQ